MIIEFLHEAEDELFEAAKWYESKESGLGVRFRDEFFNTYSIGLSKTHSYGENVQVAIGG